MLTQAREVELDDESGDVVMFHGSSTWHLRRNAAGAVNLSLKINDFGCDPVGEDPQTPRIRARTQALLAEGADLDDRIVTAGHGEPRLHPQRLGGAPRGQALRRGGIWHQRAVGRRAPCGARRGPARRAGRRAGGQSGDARSLREAARTLLDRGVLDLS